MFFVGFVIFFIDFHLTLKALFYNSKKKPIKLRNENIDNDTKKKTFITITT